MGNGTGQFRGLPGIVGFPLADDELAADGVNATDIGVPLQAHHVAGTVKAVMVQTAMFIEMADRLHAVLRGTSRLMPPYMVRPQASAKASKY